MLHPLTSLLLIATLQAAPGTPPVLDGAGLPSVELEIPDEHGGLDLFQFSPDGSILAGATRVGTVTWDDVQSSFGGEVILWDPLTGKILKTLGSHRTSPTTLQFSSDGRRLLSYSGQDHDARLWSIPDGALLAEVSLGGPGAGEQPPVLSPDGRILLHLAERTIDLSEDIDVAYLIEAWNLEAGKRLWTRTVDAPHEEIHARFAISPDGTTVALSQERILWKREGDRLQGRHLGGTHELLQLASGKPVWSVALPEKQRSQRPHPEKQVLFTTDGSGILMVGRKRVHHYDASDGKPVGDPIDLEDEKSIGAIHLSADGHHFMVTRFFDRQLEIRSFPDGAELFRVSFDFPDKLSSGIPAPDLHRVVGQISFSGPQVIDLGSGFAGSDE
ncbi:MAG: WD40 repeat domain-containing protein [Phycisphaerales bacterium]|nr:WD40 repeat domain-containing protein [Phycisphaerales bacterium]